MQQKTENLIFTNYFASHTMRSTYTRAIYIRFEANLHSSLLHGTEFSVKKRSTYGTSGFRAHTTERVGLPKKKDPTKKKEADHN